MKRVGVLLLVLMLVLGGCQSAQDIASRGPVRITSVLANQLQVLGASALNGNTTVGGTLGVTGATTVTGATALNGGLTMDSTKFTVADTSGNTSIGGTLGVTGASTLTGALAANGGITVDTTNFTVNGTTGAVASASSIAAGTALSGQSVASSGPTTVGTTLLMTPATAITATDNFTLTPVGSYQPLVSAGNVGFSAITAGTAGQLLILTNNSNTTITITDTSTTMLGGNAALGQYDTLMLVSDGTNWRQYSKTDN